MALIVIIKVIPSSGKQQMALDKSGTIKCYLKSPPENGKANVELIKFLANNLKIPQTMIELISGKTARIKKIKINQDMTHEQLLIKLGLSVEKQYALF